MTREEAITRIKDHIEIHRYHERNAVKIFEALDMAIEALRQPEPQLTADNIETIRIHMNATKEKLCNQWRYKEAEEYEEIIKRLTSLPSAQPRYEELTPEEAASEIASGSMVSAMCWLDSMIRLKQMGYAICRKR